MVVAASKSQTVLYVQDECFQHIQVSRDLEVFEKPKVADIKINC